MKKKIIFLWLSCVFVSCDFVSDRIEVMDKLNDWQKYTSPYQGTWVARYTGDETGTFVLVVDEKGYVKVDITSHSSNYTDRIRGGIVFAGGGLQQVWNENFAIYGSLFNKRGTWKKGDKSGEWTAVKQ